MPRAYARHTHDTWRGVWSMLLFGTLGVLAIFGSAPQPLRGDDSVRISRIASVPLTDDDGGQSLFDVTKLAPGRSVTRCISVRYDGNPDPSEVRLRAEDMGGGVALADHVKVAVARGTGGGSGGCAGFTGADVFPGSRPLAELATAAGVATGWTPVPHQVRTFRITVSLDPAVPGVLQGARFSADLVWGVTPGAAPVPPPATTTPTTTAPTTTAPTTTAPTAAPPATVPPDPVVPAEPTAPAVEPPLSPTPSASAPSTNPPQPNANPVLQPPSAPPSPTPSATPQSPQAGGGDDDAADRPATGGTADGGPATPRAVVSRAVENLRAAAGKVVAGAREFGQAAGAAAGRAALQPHSYASIGVLFLFLLAQNRLDRRDPKLALAPVMREPYLTFADSPEAADRWVEQPPAAGRWVEQPPAAGRWVEQPPAAGRSVEQLGAARRSVEQPPAAGRSVEQPGAAVQYRHGDAQGGG